MIVFIDTNLWVYLYSQSPQEKHQVIKDLVDSHFDEVITSTQVVGELYNVFVRKGFMTKQAAKEIVLETMMTFPMITIDTSIIFKALEINERYDYSYWDSLVLATALLNNCTILFSEDMQGDQVLENKTTIINPFTLRNKINRPE